MGDSEHEAPRECRQPTAGRRNRRRLGGLYDLDRSARCAGQDQGVILSRAFIASETQKIAWDSIWGDSPTEVDASLNLPFRAKLIRKDTAMDLLAFAKNIAAPGEGESAPAKVRVAVCVIDVHGNVVHKN